MSVSRQIKIPTPHYVVFYNGTERKEQEFTQRLSDAYEDDSEGCMELIVKTININYGYNQELMSKCKSLADYAYFVAEIRKNLEHMPLQEAVEQAVNVCIEKDILKDFLLEQKSEVIAMSIYEYNEEYVRKVLFEDGVEKGYNQGVSDGVEKGYSQGKVDGENRLGKLIAILMAEGKSDIVIQVSQNEDVREEYYKKYNI